MRGPNPLSVVSTTVDSRYKQLGNAVVSNAVEFLLKQLKKYLLIVVITWLIQLHINRG